MPGNFGCGSAVLAAIITLAPSLAHLNAIERPMPRDPPVINIVLPASCLINKQIYSFFKVILKIGKLT